MFERCLYFNSNHLSRTVTKVWTQAFAHLDLSPSNAYLLRLVLEKPGLLQKQIGQELHLEKSTITRFIDKLEKEKYLKRKTVVVTDFKIQKIYATQKAKNIHKELEKIGNYLYEQSKNIVDLDDLKHLVTNMRNIANKLD